MDIPVPDDEEEQLKLAIAISLKDAQSEQNISNNICSSTSSSVLGLDRKAMEQERLARARAPEPVSARTYTTKKRPAALEEENTSLKPPSSHSQSTSKPENHKRIKLDVNEHGGALRFRRGKILKTWCYGFERSGQDIKIEEVLDKHELRLAVLSSFQWDVPWVLSKVKESTKLVFVMQAKDEATRDLYRRETVDMLNLRLCFPPMPGNVNCMHSKLMLLSYPSHLRVVIPTANLLPFDWGETGVMENSLFLIDLPRRDDGSVQEEAALPQFGQDLVYFCQAMGLQDDIVRSIGKFDFSKTKAFEFVHSIGGEHKVARRRTGYPGLGQAVSRLGLSTTEVELDFVASSIGAVNEDLVRMLYFACTGDDGMIEFKRRTSKTKKTESIPEAYIDNIIDRFRVYFPSSETIHQSKGGPENAGTVCFQERWWESPKFPKKILYDCKSVRTGLLMHNKMILVQRASDNRSGKVKIEDETSADDRKVNAHKPNVSKYGPNSWVYLGSANFSESAWGRLVQDRATKEPKLTCRNWECGIVFPCDEIDVPMPMQVPSTNISGSGLTPWFGFRG